MNKGKIWLAAAVSLFMVLVALFAYVIVSNNKEEKAAKPGKEETVSAPVVQDRAGKEALIRIEDDSDAWIDEYEKARSAAAGALENEGVSENAVVEAEVTEESGEEPGKDETSGLSEGAGSEDKKSEEEPAGEASETEESPLEKKADEILAGMTLEEKIYQMFILTPEQVTGEELVTSADSKLKKNLIKCPVGGLVYFESNLKDPDQTREMLDKTKDYCRSSSGLTPFLCIDEEGGRVLRIGSNPSFNVKKIPAMAEIKSKEKAYAAGETIGKYLKDLGFNVDFAPDADVLTNRANKVIGERSFGRDPDIVTRYARAYSNGLHSAGILSTYKHFPGHGVTSDDTHEGLAETDKDLVELSEAELIPFMDAHDAGADLVMVSHISVPSIINDTTPCSLSQYMVTDVLKGKLDFDGLVITDSLRMGAISSGYTSEEACVLAIKAGNDLLLMPDDHEAAVAAILEEVRRRRIPQERIDESVRKIILKKLEISE
ncbi:MAG: glycoside hydrolase family 3 protein [Lachnospiraceae bacterium]|nr:glycoside hydrolase family 3 protein [Lachnospiraceae bacterium]